MIRRILLTLAVFAFVAASASATTYSDFVATPTTKVVTSVPTIGFVDVAPTTLTLTADTIYNVCDYLGSNDYRGVTFQVTSGTVYLAATTTALIGFPIASGTMFPPIDLPILPKDRFQIPLHSSATCTVLIYPIRAK